MPRNPKFYAHTPPKDQPDQWQAMHEHEEAVAQLASEFAAAFGAETLAQWCGLLHDVGKYSLDFQQYLRDCDKFERKLIPKKPLAGSAEHKTAGAKLATHIWKNEPEIARLLSFCILGHHGGLPSSPDQKIKLADVKDRKDIPQAIANAIGNQPGIKRLSTSQPVDSGVLLLEQSKGKNGTSETLYREMLTRFVFSALVDADSLDTEAHFHPEDAEERKANNRPLKEVCQQWLATLKAHQDELQAKVEREAVANPDLSDLQRNVIRVRKEVYEDCLEAAKGYPGVYTLTVPTGGGKTRSSLAFALAHAVQHLDSESERSRIIYIAPYTSILDQTAGTFREILGDDSVLEHHSAVDVEKQLKSYREESADKSGRNQGENSSEVRRRLQAQNWAAPLIVSTSVQFFESLFAASTSRCRKLHNYANSVILLDEIQTIPLHLLRPLLSGLKALAQHFGATIVLCTATQPAISGANSPFEEALPEPIPIVKNSARHFNDLKRVNFRVIKDISWTWHEVVAELEEARRAKNTPSSCLAIFNTKKDALAVLDELGNAPDVFHLSTLLCQAHRRAILQNIKEALEAERNEEDRHVLLVTTQIIEAGVDIDFPNVFRAQASLDRIIQSGGRCNREGRRKPADSLVTVFNPAEGSAPQGDYRTAMEETWPMICTKGFDFHISASIDRYYSKLYKTLDRYLDKKDVLSFRKAWDFPEVARRTILIEDDTAPLIVPYHQGNFPNDPKAMTKASWDDLIEDIRKQVKEKGALTCAQWNLIRPITVAVFRNEIDKTVQYRDEEILRDELYLFGGVYDTRVGIGRSISRDTSDLIA